LKVKIHILYDDRIKIEKTLTELIKSDNNDSNSVLIGELNGKLNYSKLEFLEVVTDGDSLIDKYEKREMSFRRSYTTLAQGLV
jgi:hypothetical protein